MILRQLPRVTVILTIIKPCIPVIRNICHRIPIIKSGKEVSPLWRHSLIKGVLILAGAGLLNRIIGFIYRIVVMRTIGPEGVGLYEMVFPLYTLIVVITTAGIPIAIAKTVAELKAKRYLNTIKKLLFLNLAIMIFTSILAFIIILMLRPIILPTLLPDPRAIFPFMTMVPALILVALSSVIRGYFQGLQQMTPSAISQVSEQIVRTSLGVALAYKLMPYGPAYAATGLAVGMVIGETIGLISLLFFLRQSLRKKDEVPSVNDKKNIFPIMRQILFLAMPVTSTRIVAAGIMSLQAILIPKRLQAAGLSVNEATATFGEFTGIALSLIGLPTLFSNAMAISLVPSISEALIRKQYEVIRHRVQLALSITVITGLPWVILYLFLPDNLTQIIFGKKGFAQPLQLLALGSIFLYLQQTMLGIFQGLGRVDIALKNIVFGAIINLALVYYLTGIELLSIRGTAIAYSVTWFLVSVLNLYQLVKLLKIRLNLKEMIIVPLIGSFGMAIIIAFTWWQLWQLFGNALICTLFSIISGLLIYLGLVFYNSQTIRYYIQYGKK
jgi:stage V sporulation protein B